MFEAEVIIDIVDVDHLHISRIMPWPFLPTIGTEVLIGGNGVESTVTRVRIIVCPESSTEPVTAWIYLQIEKDAWNSMGIEWLYEMLAYKGWKSNGVS